MLPVRGQRTWSNANCASRSNVFLKDHKYKLAKALYGQLQNVDTRVSLMAEHINLL